MFKNKSKYQLTYDINLVVTLLTICLITYASIFSWQSWHSARNKQIQHLTDLMELTGKALNTYFLHLDHAMNVLSRELSRKGFLVDLNTALPTLQNFLELHTGLKNVSLLDKTGQILLTARTPPASDLPTLAAEPSFIQFQKELEGGHYEQIGRPLISVISKEWIIPSRFLIKNQAGHVLYIISSNIAIEIIENFWKDAPFTKTAALGLIRDDGFLVSRYPVPESKQMTELYDVPRQGALMDYLRSNNYPSSGVVAGYSSTSDTDLFYTFKRLDDFPITLFIALPASYMYEVWIDEIRVTYVLFAFFMIFSALVYGMTLKKQRQKETAILESEAFARDIINTVTSQVAVVDANGKILLVNEAWRQFGRNNGFQDMYFGVGLNYLDICRIAIDSGATEAQKALDGILAVIDGSALDFSMEYTCDSPERRRCFIMRVAGLSDGHRFVITHYNITERREAEEQRILLEKRVQKAQKSESLARMASSVAHTFNNMLGAVLGNLELVLMDIEPDASYRTHILEAMKASRKAATISKFMLTYLGKAGGTLEPTDMSSIINEACAFFHSALPKNITLSCMKPSAKYIVNTDSAQLLQILNNLINNAVEAIGELEGSIDVTFDTVQGELIEVSDSFSLDWLPSYSDYVCITISDTGEGITYDNLGKIFDPFFSTKFTGRGLGLSVVCGLLKTLEGAIAVESEVGKGTVFKIYIPICEHYPISESDDPEEKPISGGTTLVLVVDDEDTMRGMATAMLKRVLGYEVITAENGHCAIEILKDRKDDIGFIILDLTMPGMDGWETLQAIRAIRADIPVILSSGYNEAQVKEGRRVDEMPQAFLSKPYRTDDLKEAIKTARKH